MEQHRWDELLGLDLEFSNTDLTTVGVSEETVSVVVAVAAAAEVLLLLLLLLVVVQGLPSAGCAVWEESVELGLRSVYSAPGN